MKKFKLTRELLDDTFTAHAYEQNLSVDVLSSGPLNSTIAFVGEGPGEAEVRHRPKPKPFVGGSGKLLWNHVYKFGYTQDNIYCTNVVKRQISLSRKGNLRNPVTADEFNKWSELLRWELTQLPNVKIIVALGNYALEALTENTGITKWRGSVLDTVLPNGRLGQVIVTFNPAYVVEGREPRFEPFFLMDLMRIAQVEKGVFKPHNINKIINPTYKEALAYISDMQKDVRPIALDTEAINEEVACIGLSNNPHEAICIAFRSATKNMYTKSQEVDILLAIQKLADTSNMIAQNAQFDSYFMWLGLKLEIDFWFDILLGHHTLYPQLPHSLAFMTTQYTNHPFYKDDADGWYEGGNIDSFWEYNCIDCAITYAVFEKQQAELKKRKLDKFFFDHVMRAQPHLVRATVHGVAVDVPMKQKILDLVRIDVDEQREKVYGIIAELTEDIDYRPNINSAPQMQDLYFNRLKLIGRGTSTDDNNRKEMMKSSKTSPKAKQLLLEIDKFKEDHKFMSTYAEAKVSDDSRFRCEYKQFGVSKAPGRLSSSSLLVTKEGGNMQNQPMRARGMYVADPDMVFLYFDLAQAEAQVVSFRADIPKWKEQFAKAKLDGSYDCHRALASEMFKMPYDEVPKADWDENLKPTKRYISKRCLTSNASVLTKSGWKSIATAARLNDAIAIWSTNYTITWEVPSNWFVDDHKGKLIHFNGESVCQTVTHDHRMPMINNGNIGERLACEFLNTKYGSLPLNGTLFGGTVCDSHARLLAMSWSDGSIEKHYPNSVRVSVVKERKAIRVRELVQEADLQLWEGFSGGLYHFRVYGFHQKKLHWDMLFWSENSRLAFLDEVLNWDGHRASRRVLNTDLEGLRIIQALAHVSGLRASIVRHGVPKDNEIQCYVLRLISQANGHYQSMEIFEVDYEGKVYCPTVSTGAFLVCENDKVSVTLNCRHGLNYRMERFRLSQVTQLPYNEASQAFVLYHKITPELELWWNEEERQFRLTRTITNAFGRELRVIQRIDENVLESIIAFYAQSTIGDKIVQVWYQSEEDDEWPLDARVCIDVHDNLVALASPKTAKTALKIMKKYAESPIIIQDVYNKRKPEPLSIPCDLKMSYPSLWDDEKKKFVPDKKGLHRWSEMEKVKL